MAANAVVRSYAGSLAAPSASTAPLPAWTQVRDLNDQAFGTTTESRIVDALRDARGSISLVATTDNHVIGHILFTPVTIESPIAERVAGLGPMAVRPENQRAGVGTRLVEAGLDECRCRGYQAVVVVGHPEYLPTVRVRPGAHEGTHVRVSGAACGLHGARTRA